MLSLVELVSDIHSAAYAIDTSYDTLPQDVSQQLHFPEA